MNAKGVLQLLHLCDTLFPLGAFAHSEGLEGAVAAEGAAQDDSAPDRLQRWLDVLVDESFGRADGPTVWRAWRAFDADDYGTLATIDEEIIALRPAASARGATRAMGLRLVRLWHTLHPDPRLERLLTLARSGILAPALPVGFAAACASGGSDRRTAVEAFGYTRVAATVSAAMRLMPLGQTAAHVLLAHTLDRLPRVVDGIVRRDTAAESFMPSMDIAAMTHQYLHSRLFRS
jgi:urease accessory protein